MQHKVITVFPNCTLREFKKQEPEAFQKLVFALLEILSIPVMTSHEGDNYEVV